MKKTLRPDQQATLNNLRSVLHSGKKRVMVQAPTGWGKTVFGSAIVQGSVPKRKRVLMMVPSLDLIGQTQLSLAADGLANEVGIIQADHPDTNGLRPVQVASTQTLVRRKALPEFDIVLIDEAHEWFSYYDTHLFPEAARRGAPIVGLSATPWTKGLGASGRYEHLLIASTTAECIRAGLLADFEVFAPTHPDLSNVKIVAGDYHEGQLSSFMRQESLVGDQVRWWLRIGNNEPTLAFAVDRAHAQAMTEKFRAAGIPTEYVDGETPADERARIKRGFACGQVRVVWNVDVFSRGTDWDVRCLQMSRPTKSEIKFVQIIGRGLRLAKGKDRLKIIDHTDNHLARFGYVTDIHHEHLDDGDVKRLKPKPIDVKKPAECPACHRLREPAVLCPCGYRPSRHTRAHCVDGELDRLERLNRIEEAARRKTIVKASDDPRREKAIWHAMLLGYAQEKGFKPGWAAHAFKDKFGEWPSRSLGVRPMMADAAVRGWVKHRTIVSAKEREKQLAGLANAALDWEPSGPRQGVPDAADGQRQPSVAASL
jgi:DNA repair protein RadD